MRTDERTHSVERRMLMLMLKGQAVMLMLMLLMMVLLTLVPVSEVEAADYYYVEVNEMQVMQTSNLQHSFSVSISSHSASCCGSVVSA